MDVVRLPVDEPWTAVPTPRTSGRTADGPVPGPPPIRLAVVDPNRVFAEVIAARLGTEPDIQVLRCAVDATAFRELVAAPAIDVVLADAGLFEPGTALPERGARAPRGAVVLVAEPRDQPRLVPAVRAGVRGWVPRTASIEALLSAVREAAAGGTWLPPKILTRVLRELLDDRDDDAPARALLGTLTPREREVLCCLAEGLERRAVAARLRMSTNTLRTHVASILAKLDVSSSLAAVALLRNAGGAPVEPPR